ncbi:anti-sigma factor [Undibacterium sp.]|jgi:anti-sigma factor RsiW|uniref:anti-sigma factor family protein n=1 Tax=Undibacterium sp. TaxID=1914977 RepID=UPI002BCD3FA8|nr:anti-sigma factor [Undibacterium sp.]HTD03800.1 anti-sigma factor [Undibacterium sp.]
MKPAPITEAELHAYVDGLLPASKRQQVEAWLQATPADAEQVRIYRDQNASLRALFSPVLEEPVPAALQQAGPGEPHVPAATNWSLLRIAASVVLALGSGALGWSLRDWQSISSPVQQASPYARGDASAQNQQLAMLPQQAAIAHAVFSPEVRHPVEVGVDQEAHLVAWLSKRLGTDLHPPRLGAQGYELIGGRLLPGNSGPVAQFMYNDASGQRLTLYVATENSANHDTGFRFAQEGQVNVFYWIDGKFGYAISGSVAKNELSRIASSVYDQLQAN